MQELLDSWGEHGARMGKNAGFWLGNLKEWDCLENLGSAYGGMILK